MFREISRRINNLLSAPAEELGRWARFVRFNLRLGQFGFKRLRLHNAMAMSAALSFRTLFAMVPAMVLAFLILKSAGYLQQGKASVYDLLDDWGLAQISLSSAQPSSQPTENSASSQSTKPSGDQPPEPINAADKIMSIVNHAEKKLTFTTLGPIGIVLLAWTGITLLITMERSLNRIFEAHRSRSILRRYLLYFLMMAIFPTFIVSVAHAGQLARQAVEHLPLASGILGIAEWAGKFVLGITILAAVYKLMPNTLIPFHSAAVGAIVAIPLWLIAKWAFGMYVTQFVGHDKLYGNLALVPLFLFWINLCWWIFLFGAEFAYTAVNVNKIADKELALKKIEAEEADTEQMA